MALVQQRRWDRRLFQGRRRARQGNACGVNNLTRQACLHWVHLELVVMHMRLVWNRVML